MALKNKTHEIEPATKQRAPQQIALNSIEHERSLNPVAALQRATSAPPSALRPADVLALQRTVGNRAVQRMLAGPTRKAHASASSAGPTIQAKLTIGAAGDQYEQEADRVARQVMSMGAAAGSSIQLTRESEEEDLQRKPSPLSITPLVQRQTSPDDEEELQTSSLQRETSAEAASAGPGIETAIQQARGSGQSLPETLRARMERAFGADFGSVRVHTDSAADGLNRSLQARAFTTGENLFFKQGEYNPNSRDGQQLIAHELTHVVQQNGPSRARTQGESTEGLSAMPISPRKLPPSVQRKTREEEAEDRATVTTEEKETEFGEKAKNLVSATELSKTQVKAAHERYEEAVQSWKDYPNQQTILGLEAAKKNLILDILWQKDIEQAKKDVSKQIITGRSKLEPEEAKQKEFNVYWRTSYLSQKQNEDLADKDTKAKKVVDLYRKKVEKLEALDKELAGLELGGTKELITIAKTTIDRAKAAVADLRGVLSEDPDVKKAAVLLTELNSIIENELMQMLQKAMTDEKLLDIEDNDRKAIAKYLMGRDKQNATDWIASVAKFQHLVTKNEWRLQLGLNEVETLYYWVAAPKIGNSGVHKTLYKDSIHDQDVAATESSKLKDEVLGTGDSGFHVTLEQEKNSHAYRKGNVSMRNYVQGQGDLPYQEARTVLSTLRDDYVAEAEATIQKIKDDKGKGVKTKAVKAKLGI